MDSMDWRKAFDGSRVAEEDIKENRERYQEEFFRRNRR
jgi:hypothetical protein